MAGTEFVTNNRVSGVSNRVANADVAGIFFVTNQPHGLDSRWLIVFERSNLLFLKHCIVNALISLAVLQLDTNKGQAIVVKALGFQVDFIFSPYHPVLAFSSVRLALIKVS